MTAQRIVHHEDALAWLSARPVLEGASVVTSLPDVSELPGLDLGAWKAWFRETAALCVDRCPREGVAIFYQTDVKRAGTWVDKGYLVQRGAEDAGAALLFHKIVCRKPPGTITHGRPAYSHLLAFSRGVRNDLSRATADVLPDAGEMTWTRAMGAEACRAACRFVLACTTTRTVVDPFCGKGTVLAAANELGLDAIGVELSRRRARQARTLTLGRP